MGNTIDPSHPLPQIWERINAQYLRHRFTQEIIEEHTLLLPSQQEQIEVVNRLKQRIALHHISIAKVIYFKHSQEQSICSPTANHPLLIYTEYTGDTLERVAEEKGERLYHLPCQCNYILTAADYLRDHYGCFQLTPALVFLGSRKEKNTKVWIHSRVELTEREHPANEHEMCDSICRLLRYIKNNRICLYTNNQHLAAMQRISSLTKLKEIVFDIHRNRQDHNKHKKSNSVVLAQPRQEEPNAQAVEVEENRKSGKANSMPQKDEGEKSKGNQTKSKEHYQKYTTPQFFYRSVVHPNPVKINFIYPKQQNKNKSLPQPQSQNNFQIEQSQKSKSTIKDGLNGANSLFSALIPMADSVTNSPQGGKLQQPYGNFTAREMELPLHEVRQKITPARLPTTSRSPKLPKEPTEMKHAEQPQSIPNSRYKRKVSQQQPKKEKPSSLNSSGKFQKYKDAIKNYEEKLRLKFANSMGGLNPLANKAKAERKVVSSPPKGGEFKETKSVYNDSQDDLHQSKEEKSQPFDEGSPQAQNPQIPQNFQAEEQNKKMRQQLQKQQLQHELEKEKVIIQNEMQDVLKQNAMRDEYRNIREKIKHKKETFAQLKAEATKILEDLDF